MAKQEAIQPGTSVTVNATSTAVVSANQQRDRLYITNTGTTDVTLRLASSGAVANAGILLKPGGAFYDEYEGPVCAIVASGTGTLGVVEV